MQLISDINNFNLIIFFIFAIIFGCSMYGWGQLFFFKNTTQLISLKIVKGMGITLFFGGILNYLSLANQDTIRIIFLFGLVLFIIKIYNARSYLKLKRLFENFKKINLIVLVPILLLILNIFLSISPETYNYHDDFQKYFLHPIKMLETGSVFGSTLAAIGSETFGGQAFFQSFYISWLGLKAINIFDSIFCLSLSSLLILEWSYKKKILVFGVLISSLVILIHEQYVNVSSIYSGVLFIISSIIFSLELFKDQSGLKQLNIKIVFGISLCFASIFILKPTYGIFSSIYFTFYIFFLIFVSKFNKDLIKLIILTPFFSILISFPWIIFTLKNFINSRNLQHENFDPNSISLESYLPNLISTKQLFYGATQLHYSLLILIGILSILPIVYLSFKKKIDSNVYQNISFITGTVSLVSCSVIYLIFMILAGLNYIPLSNSIRYSIPFIVALTPIGTLVLYTLIPYSLKYTRIILFLSIISFLIAFIPQYLKNISQIFNCGSKLSFKSFACSDNYINYNKKILSNNKRLSVREWQKNIPDGEPLMAWINAPFYLDFNRNEIFEIDIVGLDNSWAIFPSAKYIILEYNSFATRSIKALSYTAKNETYYDRKDAVSTLNFIKKINKMLSSGKITILKKDESVIIFKIL